MERKGSVARMHQRGMTITLTPPWKKEIRSPDRPRKLPRQPKIALTAFVAVLIPVYLLHRDYGARNFLYFCDLALLLTIVGLWLENCLLLSMQAVGILTVQALWSFDYLAHYVLGFCPFGLSSYAFGCAPLLHFLTLFHVWLPLLLLWALWKLGYDRRAWALQSVVVWPILLISVFCIDPMHDVNFTASYLNLTMDGLLEGRLPEFLNFINEGFHRYTHWRLSLPPAWAYGINVASGLVFTPFVLLLPAHLLLVGLFEDRTTTLIKASAPPARGFGLCVRRLFWVRQAGEKEA
jgi:hypothetical protein